MKEVQGPISLDLMGWSHNLFLETFVQANYVENNPLRAAFPRKEKRKNAGLVSHNKRFGLSFPTSEP